MFALAIQVLGAGLGYLTQVAFARWMGVSQFGLYAYLMAWATILALVSGLGFPLSVVRFIPAYRAHGEHDRVRGLIRLSRRVVLAAGVVVVIVGMAIALGLGWGAAPAAIIVAIWLVPIGALINVDSSIIRAGGRIVGAYAPSMFIRPLVILLAAGAVWLASKRLTASTGLMITLGVFVIVSLLQSKFVREVAQHGEGPKSVSYETRRWLRVSMPLLLVAGFQVALSQTDLIVVGAVRGVRYAGLYSAAAKTAMLVSYLLMSLNAVAAPLFSEFEAKGDRAGLQRLATVSAQWVFWPTLVIAGGLALLAPHVLGLFGPSFVAARGTLLILLIGQLVSAGCGAVGYLLSMTGHQNDMARVYGITSVLNLLACYAGTRAFGLAGAACATTISLAAWNVWLHHLTVKRIGVRASIVSSVAMGRARRDA
jgi:O-antigen/teichoic acid export membrane protein